MKDYCTLCGRLGHTASGCPWALYFHFEKVSDSAARDQRQVDFAQARSGGVGTHRTSSLAMPLD